MSRTTHIAGTKVTINDRYLRQICSWCGYILTDYDLENLAVPVGNDRSPGYWEPGSLVVVEGGMSYTIDSDKLPEDSCAFPEKEPAEAESQPSLILSIMRAFDLIGHDPGSYTLARRHAAIIADAVDPAWRRPAEAPGAGPDYFGVMGHLSDEEILQVSEAMVTIGDAWPVVVGHLQGFVGNLYGPVKTVGLLMQLAVARATEAEEAASRVKEGHATDEDSGPGGRPGDVAPGQEVVGPREG